MVKPRPVPPYLRVVDESAWVKGEKIDSCFSAGMPMPVSATVNRMTSRVVVFAFDFHLQRNLTVMRKFDRVTHQVENDLAQPSRISLYQFRHFGCDVTEKLQTPFIGAQGECLQSFFRAVAQVEVDCFQFNLSCFDLGVVKDVIDHREKRIGRQL